MLVLGIGFWVWLTKDLGEKGRLPFNKVCLEGILLWSNSGHASSLKLPILILVVCAVETLSVV